MKILNKFITLFLILAIIVAILGTIQIFDHTSLINSFNRNSEIQTVARYSEERIALISEIPRITHENDCDKVSKELENITRTITSIQESNTNPQIIGLLKQEEQISSIEMEMRNIQKEFLKNKALFEEKSLLEKEQRYQFREPLLALEDNTITDTIGKIQYYSKETLYQYKDIKHANEWVEQIQKLANIIKTSNLSLEEKKTHTKSLMEYNETAVSMSSIAIREKEITNTQNELISELHSISKEQNIMIQEIIEDNQNTLEDKLKQSRELLIFLVTIASIILVILGIITSRVITKPLKELTIAAQKIGKGELCYIPPSTKDEIGELANEFNIAVVKLEKAQAELEKYNQTLEEKVHERTKDLERANRKILKSSKELESSNKLKDLLNDILRHDILNPITAIKMYSEMMLEKDSEPDPKLFTKILKSADRIEKIIASAREFAKIENISKLDTKRKNIIPIINSAIEQLQPEYKKEKVRIINRLPKKMVVPHHELIEEVFLNILSNDAKYAKNGKKVEIRSENKDKFVYIKFVDYGEGVADQFKQAIFTRLTRKEKIGVQGTGLGLAIAKKIVELHKGEVWVEDNPQGGAIFVVKLPLA